MTKRLNYGNEGIAHFSKFLPYIPAMLDIKI